MFCPEHVLVLLDGVLKLHESVGIERFTGEKGREGGFWSRGKGCSS